MAPGIISFIVGITLGFVLGAYWTFRRRRRRGLGPGLEAGDGKFGKSERDDNGDSAADVDRRMAYGAYEDAAEIVTAQIEQDPSDVQLKAKLLEIYFVWGSEEKFLAAFREFESDLLPSKYWTQVSVMGAQICPNEPVFTDT